MTFLLQMEKQGIQQLLECAQRGDAGALRNLLQEQTLAVKREEKKAKVSTNSQNEENRVCFEEMIIET